MVEVKSIEVLLLRHMQLKEPNVPTGRGARRPAEEGGEVPDVANVVLRRLLLEPARRHVVDRALTQRADGLVEEKRKLLSRMGLNSMISRQAPNFSMLSTPPWVAVPLAVTTARAV